MIRWHTRYRPEWDSDPWCYLREGVLPLGRSRRLGSLAANGPALKVHLGVQHFDPALWGYRGEPYCRFFVSMRVGSRATVRTFETMTAALAALQGLDAAPAPEG